MSTRGREQEAVRVAGWIPVGAGARGWRTSRRARALGLALAVLAVLLACSSHVGNGPITTRGGGPTDIVLGPDGNLWFCEVGLPGIGRMTPDGKLTEFKLPPTSWPDGLAVGPDGNLWFGYSNGGDAIGRLTLDGVSTRFPYQAQGAPHAFVAGTDGALWFVDSLHASIGRVTTAGAVTTFPLPNDEALDRLPTDLAAGPDGNLWFTEGTGTSSRARVFLGRITVRGTITEFPLPSGVVLNTLAAAADGTLWFTESAAGKIGRIRPDGTIVEFVLPANPDDPTLVDMPVDIAAGPGGTLWVALVTRQGAKIGRVTPDGAVPSEYPLHAYGMVHLATGPDGNLWFTIHDANLIGRMTPTGAFTTFMLPVERVDLRTPNP